MPAAKPSASLPPMEFPFEIQVVGRETGLNWVGKFLYKRPSLGARARIDVMRARLSGDQVNLMDEVVEFNEAAAHLRHTLVESPQWWKDANFGLDLYDGNVVSEIYNKCMEYERTWKEKVFGGNAKEVSDDAAGDLAQEAEASAP